MSKVNTNLPSSSLSKEELDNILSSIRDRGTQITNLTNSYNSNIKIITDKLNACGVSTASNANGATIATNIQTLYTNRYNQGISDGRVGYVTESQYNNYGNQKYNEGVTAADNRANPNSTNYQTGYNNGVTDGRRGYYTQAQYDANYNNGFNAGKSSGYSTLSSATGSFNNQRAVIIKGTSNSNFNTMAAIFSHSTNKAVLVAGNCSYNMINTDVSSAANFLANNMKSSSESYYLI